MVERDVIQEQEPLPDVPEPDEPYRRPVETMTRWQIEHELKDLFGVAVMYLLIPVFFIALSLTNWVATPFFLRVLPASAVVFVCYWILLRTFASLYDAAPETARWYTRHVSRWTGGIMSTPHERVLELLKWRERLEGGMEF